MAEARSYPKSQQLARGERRYKRLLLSRLSDAEYAYMIDKGGEDYPTRAYGVSYER